VAVLADRKRQVVDTGGLHRNILMGTAQADSDGRFALEFPAVLASPVEHLSLLAVAPGRGLNVAELKLDPERHEVSISLPAETPIEGRLVDVQGQPAAGLVVRVGKLNFKHELRDYHPKSAPSHWPAPVTTDRDGRFWTLGLGAETAATFEVDDPRYAHQSFSFTAEIDGELKLGPGATITLRPARTIDVRVTRADDAKPAVGARVKVHSIVKNGFPTFDIIEARTDAQGGAKVAGWPARVYRIEAYPPEDEPYLPAWSDIEWPNAALQQSVDLKLLS